DAADDAERAASTRDRHAARPRGRAGLRRGLHPPRRRGQRERLVSNARSLVGHNRPIVQPTGVVRQEPVEVVRQPRLLLVLSAGPFLVLLLFAVGYDQQQAVLRTAFVGPEDSLYVDSMERFSDELRFYITNEGYGSDLEAAERRLQDGEVDVVV